MCPKAGAGEGGGREVKQGKKPWIVALLDYACTNYKRCQKREEESGREGEV